MEERNRQQMRGYREMPEEELFDIQWVRVRLGPEDMPGYKSARVTCAECGEGISFKREVVQGGRGLCRSCAGERYYELGEAEGDATTLQTPSRSPALPHYC